MWLAVRSLLWAVVLPGTVAVYLPWRFFGLGSVRLDLRDPMHIGGGALFMTGALLLALCIWEFAATGRGTLAPVDPPRELVVAGLYRYVRNPMYLSMAMILLGELLLTRSNGLFIFAAVWFVIVNLFVIGYEEPYLRRRFGVSYEAYATRVGRWLPRGLVFLMHGYQKHFVFGIDGADRRHGRDRDSGAPGRRHSGDRARAARRARSHLRRVRAVGGLAARRE